MKGKKSCYNLSILVYVFLLIVSLSHYSFHLFEGFCFFAGIFYSLLETKGGGVCDAFACKHNNSKP